MQDLGCLTASAPESSSSFATACLGRTAAATWDVAGAPRDVASERVQLPCVSQAGML